jgi:hypothetical protein
MILFLRFDSLIIFFLGVFICCLLFVYLPCVPVTGLMAVVLAQ